MTSLLALAFLALSVFFLRHRRRTRAQWRHLGGLMDDIARGERPASFILHGEKTYSQLGLKLETLVDQRERLESQISLASFALLVISFQS